LFSLGRTVKYDSVFTPGPGRYDCTKKIGDKKMTISQRFKELNWDFYKMAPNVYKPAHRLTERENVK